MATMKLTAIFNDGGAGWSESYYLPNRSADPELSKPLAIEILKLRAEMLARGTAPNFWPFLEAFRLTNVDAPNASTLYTATPAIRDANIGNPAVMSGTRTLVLNLFTFGRVNVRKLALRGLPSQWLEQDLNSNRSNVMVAALKAIYDLFRAFLLPQNATSPVGIRVRSYTVVPNNLGITAASRDTVTGHWKIRIPLLVAPIPIPSEIFIRNVRGSKGIRGINGRTIVTAVGAGAIYTLNKFPCNSCEVSISNPGQILSLGPVTYPAVTGIEVNGYGQRKTGKAFFAPRGRRCRKACR